MSYKTTIIDIARELNTTPATVSRALSNHPGISEKQNKQYNLQLQSLIIKETGSHLLSDQVKLMLLEL
jgi:hypothetical protein